MKNKRARMVLGRSLVLGFVIVNMIGCGNSHEAKSPEVVVENNVEVGKSETEKESDEAKIAEAVQNADIFWAAGNCKEALKIVETALEDYPDSHTLHNKKEEYENLMAEEPVTEEKEESDETVASNTVEKSPFYGVWCIGTKSESDAQKCADKLKDNGYNAQVYITTEWQELNAEKWYVVSADEYETKAEAEADLEGVKAIYSGAYVKYTGDYCGE